MSKPATIPRPVTTTPAVTLGSGNDAGRNPNVCKKCQTKLTRPAGATLTFPTGQGQVPRITFVTDPVVLLHCPVCEYTNVYAQATVTSAMLTRAERQAERFNRNWHEPSQNSERVT